MTKTADQARWCEAAAEKRDMDVLRYFRLALGLPLGDAAKMLKMPAAVLDELVIGIEPRLRKEYDRLDHEVSLPCVRLNFD